MRIELAQLSIPPTKSTPCPPRFYRVDTSGKVSGTGLGMSIVKEIMALHHGSVEVDSTLGQGTQVTLIFPAAPNA